MIPYKHQQHLLDLNPAKWLMCHDTGTGKTITATMLAIKNCHRVLIICPKSVKAKWPRDIAKCEGHEKVRWEIVTKEEFRRDWQTYAGKYDGIIVDECHHFTNMSSQLSKSLYKFIKNKDPRCVWLLSASPYRREPFNLYTLARYLGQMWSYNDFRNKYYVPKFIYNRMIWEIRPGIEEDMARIVNLLGNSVPIDECADIPEQVFEEEFFELTKEQKAAIKEVEENETAPIVKFTKIHQIENGTLKGDGYIPDAQIRNNKDERILEICEENDKVAIFCRYNHQIELLQMLLMNKFPGRPVYVINGETKSKDAITLQVEDEKKCVVLINGACAEGYELPSIHTIIFASKSFSFVDHKQSCGRFMRLNKMHKKVFITLITEGDSIDAAVYKAIQNKVNFDIEIYKRT